jgi:hypothetical protein
MENTDRLTSVNMAPSTSTFEPGDASTAAPLSAGGSLTVRAATIDQGGVLRAPLGSITLAAADTLTLRAGSVTSVAGGATPVPDSNPSAAPLPTKAVKLQAGAVDVAEGATIDLSGGGDKFGYQFVPGPGGSTDVFTGSDGAFAIVPDQTGLAPFDLGLASSTAAPGRQIIIGAGGPLPAGRYTLLPARYALLDGAFLVRPEPGTPLSLGNAVQRPDGSVVVGALTATLGSTQQDALPASWRFTPSALARRSSEIRETTSTQAISRDPLRNGDPVPRLPADAGALVLAAQSATLAGSVRFDVADTSARGGLAFVAAERIVVDTAPQAGALVLSAETLNGIGAQTLVLGAVPGVGAGVLDVQAGEVSVAGGQPALRAADLVLAGTDRVTLLPGAALSAVAPQAGSGGATGILRIFSPQRSLARGEWTIGGPCWRLSTILKRTCTTKGWRKGTFQCPAPSTTACWAKLPKLIR